VIFAGIVVVPPTSGSFPIMRYGKMIPLSGPPVAANAPSKSGTVSNPNVVPFPITAEFGPAATFAFSLTRDTLAPFSSDVIFPLDVLAPAGYVRTGEEVTVRTDCRGIGATLE
jgi:hypothetical protein